MNSKIKTQEELAEITKREKQAGKTVGFTNGCFDILHLGHIKYLNEAKKKCALLIIGVNSDNSVRQIKGASRPLNAQQARLEVLAALEYVDFLTTFDESTPRTLIERIKPDILFKGGDWDEKDIVGADYVKAHGGKVRVIPYVEGYSTTELIERMRKADNRG